VIVVALVAILVATSHHTQSPTVAERFVYPGSRCCSVMRVKQPAASIDAAFGAGQQQ
jgi:hypothetical protein